MAEIRKDNLFKPSLASGETKYDATTRAARAIIHKEASDRDAKTQRLRLARLARDASEAEAAPAPAKAPVKKTRKKAVAAS